MKISIRIFIIIVTLSVGFGIDNAKAEDSAVPRGHSDMSVFDEFSRGTSDDNEGVKPLAIWETDLKNDDAYGNSHAIFKYNEFIYTLVYQYNSNDIHLRKFNASTGEMVLSDDGTALTAIKIPENNLNQIHGPYESIQINPNFNSDIKNSWLRFFIDDSGELGLCSFLRDYVRSDPDSRVTLKATVFKVDLNQTLINKELSLQYCATASDKNAFSGSENHVSNLFNVKGFLKDYSLSFDFLIMQYNNGTKESTGDNRWFHFDAQAQSLSNRYLSISGDCVFKSTYESRTISKLNDDTYILNTPLEGSTRIRPTIYGSCSHESTEKWYSDTENKVIADNRLFTPVYIAGEEYYITSGESGNEENAPTGFSLWSWVDKSDFDKMVRMMNLPGNKFTLNTDRYYNLYTQHCIVEYEIYDDGQAESKEETLSKRMKSLQPVRITQNPNEVTTENWRKTTCYLYSPSSGVGKYDFEPTYNGWMTSLGNPSHEKFQVISRSSNILRLDGSVADLHIYTVDGLLAYSLGNCTEVNLDVLNPGCYIAQWGDAISKVVVR